MTRRVGSTAGLAAAAVVVAALAGCGSDRAAPTASPTAATDVDVAFLQQMIPHHERAIEIAQLASTKASDPGVSAFAQRIVREQTPELARMQTVQHSVRLDTAAGARTADMRVTDDQLTTLQQLSGPAFDRQFLTLSIASEQGAVAMSQPEIGGGHVPTAVALANAINSAPTGEISQLQQLLASLPTP